MAFFFFILILW